MEKEFAGQQSWEKVLFKRREYFLSFFTRIIVDFSISIAFLILWWVFSAYGILPIYVPIIIVILIIARWILMYYKTVFYITSRRVIKIVRNWIITEHKKEKKLEDIKQIRSDKKSLLEKIFNYWTLEIESTYDHKQNLYFKWLKLVWEVEDYLWVISSYIKENWKTDDLSSFKSRKERKKNA